MKKTTLLITCLFMILMSSLSACKDTEGTSEGAGKPYDPNQPVKLSTFYPNKGGMATKVIVKGENFGLDASQIKVYYNKKRAAVVKSTGDMLYVITPRQPGEVCTLSVVVGKDSVAFDEKKTFEYKTQVTVSTIAGVAGGDGSAIDGTLAAAQFERVNYLCVDKEKNIFVCERHAYRLRQINEEQNMVATLAIRITAPFVPMVELEGQKVFLPLWVSGGDFLQFDPQTQWAKKRVKPLDVAMDEYISAAANVRDKLVYIKGKNGKLIKMNPKSKEAALVAEGLDPGMTYQAIICFDSLDPDLLYICYRDKHCIWQYNLATKEYSRFAGIKNEKGFADGKRLDAQFNEPSQICFDQDGIMYIADSKNHCIRTIDRGGIVSTVIGIPGRKGYVDGTPDDALFNTPEGVAVDDEGTIYIADTQNRCVRKLAIQ